MCWKGAFIRRARGCALQGSHISGPTDSPPHAPAMFVVREAEAAAIRVAFEERGELSAAVELRRRFPGIAGWKPVKQMPKVPRLPRVR
jgi:hypothetical protein